MNFFHTTLGFTKTDLRNIKEHILVRNMVLKVKLKKNFEIVIFYRSFLKVIRQQISCSSAKDRPAVQKKMKDQEWIFKENN